MCCFALSEAGSDGDGGKFEKLIGQGGGRELIRELVVKLPNRRVAGACLEKAEMDRARHESEPEMQP